MPIVRLVIFLFVASLAGAAFAFPAPTVYYPDTRPQLLRPTKQLACEAEGDYLTGTTGIPTEGRWSAEKGCEVYQLKNGSWVFYFLRTIRSTTACPSNSTTVGTNCSCDSGYAEQAGQCVPEQESCVAGRSKTFSVAVGFGLPSGNGGLSGEKFSADDVPVKVCDAGCGYGLDISSTLNGGSMTDPNVYWDKAAPIGVWVPLRANFSFKGNGLPCSPGPGSPSPDQIKNPTGSPPEPPTDPGAKPNNPYDCMRKGGYWGEINGVATCVQKAVDGDGKPGATTNDQSGKPPDPNSTGGSDSGSGGGTGGGTGGGSGGSGGGSGGTTNNGGATKPGPGGGTGSGSGSGSGSGGPGSGENGKLTCTDINTCDDAEAGGSLPGRPSLYEPKFPDGPSGVWSSKSAELKQAPIVGMASSLMPTVDSGSAPIFQFDMNIPGLGDFGTYQLGPDSSIWAILRAIVICSAVVMAFRLIFGGA